MTRVFVYDWDGTLFPSYEISNHVQRNIQRITEMKLDDYMALRMEQLYRIVLKIIQKSLSKGMVFILTNANYEWVDMTARKFYPEIYKMIETNQVKLMSASDQFSYVTPVPVLMKYYAFCSLINNLQIEPQSIISIGDSNYERSAVLRLDIKNGHTKCDISNIYSIKITENPSFGLLLKTLFHVYHFLDFAIQESGKNDSIFM